MGFGLGESGICQQIYGSFGGIYVIFWAAAGLSELLRSAKTGQPAPGSSSQGRSAGWGPAAVLALAG
jgi:hypothetical protein